MKQETKAITADGMVETREGGQAVIRFERRLAHPITRVWAALTEPDELVKWWGEAQLDLAVGGSFKLRWLNTDDEGNSVEMDAKIAELEPPRLLEIVGDWGGESPDGERIDDTRASLRWELEPGGDSTLLRFTNTLALSAEGRTMVPAGWHYHLDALATALDGGSVDIADPWAAWEPIHEAYLSKQA